MMTNPIENGMKILSFHVYVSLQRIPSGKFTSYTLRTGGHGLPWRAMAPVVLIYMPIV